MRKNKYNYIYVVQGLYPGGNGWEDVSASDTWKEARQTAKEYRENEPEYLYRIIHRRELAA